MVCCTNCGRKLPEDLEREHPQEPFPEHNGNLFCSEDCKDVWIDEMVEAAEKQQVAAPKYPNCGGIECTGECYYDAEFMFHKNNS